MQMNNINYKEGLNNIKIRRIYNNLVKNKKKKNKFIKLFNRAVNKISATSKYNRKLFSKNKIKARI